MAGPNMTFEPEDVTLPTQWQRAQFSKQRAYETFRHQQQAVKSFDFARFKKEFVPRLIAAYNARAKAANLPLFHPSWLELVARAEGGSAGPASFYAKHRAALQPRMFPGDPTRAKQAYDLFLKELAQLPLVRSGPVGGMIAHETGHVESFYGDPESVVRSRRPRTPSGRMGKKPPVDTVVTEAIASYNGFRVAWKAWAAFGIPRKAWGAWSGFPTYISDLTEAQVSEAMNRIKALEPKYPGIFDQANKALYEFSRYVEPVMYNTPGVDWTPKEKAALKRFVESRGGRYRETLPATPQMRLHHLRRQPYVMKEQQQGEKAMASLMAAAGEIVPFPSEKVSPATKQEKPSDILKPTFEQGTYYMFLRSMPVAVFDREHDAIMAARRMAAEFIAGSKPTLLGQVVEMEAPEDDLVDWMTAGGDIDEPVNIFLYDPKHRAEREKIANLSIFILSTPGDFPKGAKAGLPSGDMYDMPELAEASRFLNHLNWDNISQSIEVANSAIARIVHG